MPIKSLSGLIVLFLVPLVLGAAPSPPLQDDFLNSLVGNWKIERKFPSGRTAENTLHVEWVLNHQFIQLHYRDVAVAPKYEALVYFGFDDSEKSYVCHWIDVFGGQFSSFGRGKLDNSKHAIEFRFDTKEGALTNKFSFDREAKTWTSVIRQVENGEWKLFAEDKFTPAQAAK